MTSLRRFSTSRLALIATAAAALGGCATPQEGFHYGPDTAYYDEPGNYYYSAPATTTLYERTYVDREYYAPAPRYSTYIEQRDYWYYPAVGCYYDPQVRVYLYFEQNRWVRARDLPPHFRPHLGRHVIVRAPHEHPYAEHHRHRERYAPERYWDDRHREDRHARDDRRERVWLGAPRHITPDRYGDDNRRVRDDRRRGEHPVRDGNRARDERADRDGRNDGDRRQRLRDAERERAHIAQPHGGGTHQPAGIAEREKGQKRVDQRPVPVVEKRAVPKRDRDYAETPGPDRGQYRDRDRKGEAMLRDRKQERAPALQTAPRPRVQQANDQDRGRRTMNPTEQRTLQTTPDDRKDAPRGKPRRDDKRKPAPAEELADQESRSRVRM